MLWYSICAQVDSVVLLVAFIPGVWICFLFGVILNQCCEKSQDFALQLTHTCVGVCCVVLAADVGTDEGLG